MKLTEEEKKIAVEEAHERCEYGLDYEQNARELYKKDFMFANGDSDNGYQWEDNDRNSRRDDGRPCLTVNKVRQYNFNIINDARQNKAAIKFMPTGNGATFESAKIWNALARNIEYQSNASDAYDTANSLMVQAGWGHVRVVAEYVSPRSFQQRLRIVQVPDTLKVIIDPFAQEKDKSDARWAIIFEDFVRKEFVRLFPKYEKFIAQNAISEGVTWLTPETVRVAEYFRVVEEPVELVEVEDEDPERLPMLLYRDEIPEKLYAQYEAEGRIGRSRESSRRRVEWFYVVGDTVVEWNEWPGQIIPIATFVAEELIVEGKLDRKSHTRALKDPQRIYNWNTSAGVEYGALQTKTPWLAAAEAIESLEQDWKDANRQNKAVLTYNAFDEQGNPIPKPERIQPPISSPLAMDGAKLAAEEMSMVSGQYESQMGAPSNERSGKAINERQRMGDRSTYHYIDASARAIRFIGKVILDVAPRIYSQAQMLQILAEDGQSLQVKLDPTLAQAYKQEQDENGEIVERVFNPSIGTYDVQADVGPGYATRREETFNALVLLLTQAPQLVGVIGDLLMRSGDFMYADEAAERLRRMVPPQALGQGPSQSEQMMQMQIEKLKQLLGKLSEELMGAKVKLKARDEKRDVEIYRAFTERMKVLEASKVDEKGHALAVAQLIKDMMADSLDASQQAIDQRLGKEIEQELGPEAQGGPVAPQLPGAQQAPDGHWYVPDPMRKGKFLRVYPKQQLVGGGNAQQ